MFKRYKLAVKVLG
jgi:hypothetical protein